MKTSFIQLTDNSGDPCLVNLNNIALITISARKESTLYISGCAVDQMRIKERPQDILEVLKKCPDIDLFYVKAPENKVELVVPDEQEINIINEPSEEEKKKNELKAKGVEISVK